LKQKSLSSGDVDDKDWRQMLAYSAAVFQNCGNYKSFGDTKFVPELAPSKFFSIVHQSKGYQSHGLIIDMLLSLIEVEVFTESEPYHHIGFKDSNGCTSYYSGDMTEKEAKTIDDFCKKEKISPLNTRLFKINDTVNLTHLLIIVLGI
jgi:dipeptidyl-peptidase-3